MPASPPPALLAFLRGLERRARTLATAQCGDPEAAGRVWSETAARFSDEAAVLPVATWPVRFWASLVAHPAMAAPLAEGSPLAAVGPGPRAALLLRLVAGLDPRPAAEVLGVSEATYRYALQRGLEQARAAGIDADGLRALREGWQRQPPPRSPAPDGFGVAPGPAPAPPAPAVAESLAPAPSPTPTPTPPATRAHRWRAGLLALGGLAAIGLLTLAWWSNRSVPTAARPVAVLPAPVVAPDRPSPVMHPDYLLVAAPEDAKLADDLELLSWVAAGQDAVAPAPGPTPAPEPTP
jgi:hypothetical protein